MMNNTIIMNNSILMARPNEIQAMKDMFYNNIEFMYKLDVILQSERISYSVANSLTNILNSIILILNTKPKFMEHEIRDVFLHLKEHLIKRTYYCEYCKCIMPDNFTSVYEHIKTFQHFSSKQESDISHDVSIPLDLLSQQFNYSLNISNIPNIPKIEYTIDPVAKEGVTNVMKSTNCKKRKVTLNQFYKTIIPTEEEDLQNSKVYNNFLEFFMPIVIKTYPKCYVHLYGSRFYCMSHDDSNFNVFLDIRDNYYTNFSTNPEQTLKHLIENLQSVILKIFRNIPQYKVTHILDTNNTIPAIKFQNEDKFKFELCFANVTLRVYQGKLIRYLFQNALHRKICIGVLNIVKILDLKFSTYQVVLLVLYFYQTKNILPAIYYLQKDIVPLYSGIWQVNFAQNSNNIYYEKNKSTDTYEDFETNLMDFCKFYAKFEYREKIISPYLGTEIPKLDFDKTMATIPGYKEWLIQHRTIGDVFTNEYTAKIQDPIELNVNAGFEIQLKKFEKFQNFCVRGVQSGMISLKQFIPNTC